MKTTSILKSIIVLTMILACSSTMLHASLTKEAPFTTEKIETALDRAKQEGKLIFLDFSAKWCTPCKWMEETTFKDEKVIDKLSSDYIAIKVDIDETEGAIVKSNYNINFLPTLLILNSKGQLVEKIEETMTAESLIALLELHDSPGNKRIITYEPNTSPSKTVTKTESDDDWTISPAEYKKYQESEASREYKLQMGVFSSFDAANEKSNKLKDIFMEPIYVMEENQSGKIIFRVIMGEFASLSEAESFRKILKQNFELDSIIK